MTLAALTLPLLLAKPTVPSLMPLQTDLDAMCAKFNGKIGYAVVIPDTGQRISFNGDRPFPSASTIKTSILIEAVNQVDEGKLKWTDVKVVPPTKERTPNMSSMWTYFLRDDVKVNLDGWCNLMITYSDNTATKVVGMWVGNQAIKSRMEKLGLPRTAFLSYAPPEATYFRRWNRSYGMGMTTPNEMAHLWEQIYRKKVASEAGSERVLKILKRQYWDDYAGASCPPEVSVASKSGAISRSRSENAIVYGDIPYVFIVYTDDQKDQRWSSDNEGDVAIATMANKVWNYLHPKRTYTPPKGSEKFAPTGGGVE
jgi:beta-lactamase class A